MTKIKTRLRDRIKSHAEDIALIGAAIVVLAILEYDSLLHRLRGRH
tara:strand:- start:114 stop:251 length:138 start_codon:yes stop_codon:yes gene_type:complete